LTIPPAYERRQNRSRLEWLKVVCPKCGEEMTQYLTPQEEVDEALLKGGRLETVCSYCQNRIRLDARTFEPRLELIFDVDLR